MLEPQIEQVKTVETWHQFKDNIDHCPTPPFRLHAGTGYPIALRNYRSRKNVVLVFLPVGEEEQVRRIVKRFASERHRYEREDSQVLFLLPVSAARIEALHEQLASPFPLLADADGEIAQRYDALLPDGPQGESVLIFVLDRFLGCFAALRIAGADRPDLQDEILEWLNFIELQCPE